MIVQFIPAGTDTDEHLSDVMLKSAPVRPTIDTVAGKVELLVQVKVCGGLENPIAWVPKSCGVVRKCGFRPDDQVRVCLGKGLLCKEQMQSCVVVKKT